MGFTMARPQLANVNAHIDTPHIFYLVLKITHINWKYLEHRLTQNANKTHREKSLYLLL